MRPARKLLAAGALVASVAAAVACGGGSTVTAAASSDPRPVELRNQGREGDPTAATPAPTGPATAGTSIPIGSPAASSSAAPSASSSSAPTAKAAADLPKRIGARHVLIQYMGAQRAAPSVVRTKDQALAVAQEVLKRARAGEDLARLAVEYSDEPGAGARGGSLGRFGRGQMVPAFEEAAFRLKVGEVSEIVETGFGYHVIQRTE